MKTNRNYGIMVMAAALLMWGCTADVMNDSQGEVPIYLTATVSEGNGHASTRAGVDIQSTQLPSGATFTAEFSNNVTPSSVTYIADGNGGATTTTQPYFTLSGTSTTVHAYCPSKPSGTFSVQTNQSGDANYKASDLMYATVSIEKSNPVGALTFAHKMAKVIVNVTLGDGISSISAVKIVGGYRTINITDATTCTLGSTLSDANSTSGTYITAYSGTHSAGTLSCAALLPPQTVTNADFLVITTDQGDVTYTLDSKAFAIGQSYTFNATVNAAAIGTTIAITNWVDNGSTTVNPTVEVSRQAVDLGLSVKWANMNVGASSSTDFGMYFAWGDIVGRSGANIDGEATDGYSFNWDNYKWAKAGNNGVYTKYVPASKPAKWGGSGDPDDKLELDAADDAAIVCWGSPWRMPTKAELEELESNCTWEWVDSPVAGYRVTSNMTGYTSNSIFLPAAGYRTNTKVKLDGNWRGVYLSSMLFAGQIMPYCLAFDPSSNVVYISGMNFGRTTGVSVRAVQSN